MRDAVKKVGLEGLRTTTVATVACITTVLGFADQRYASQDEVDHATATVDRIDAKLDKLTTLLIRPPGAPAEPPTPGEKADEAERKLDEILRRLECERRGDCPPEPKPDEEPKR